MFMKKLNAMVCTMIIGMGAGGCIADEASFEEEALGSEEATQEVSQALDTCTTTGGGTWGNIIKLCRTADKRLYVKKRDGSSFTSSGTMQLKNWLGVLYTVNVYQGATMISFGPQLPGWYYAVYNSNAPGTAYTGEIQVQ